MYWEDICNELYVWGDAYRIVMGKIVYSPYDIDISQKIRIVNDLFPYRQGSSTFHKGGVETMLPIVLNGATLQGCTVFQRRRLRS